MEEDVIDASLVNMSHVHVGTLNSQILVGFVCQTF